MTSGTAHSVQQLAAVVLLLDLLLGDPALLLGADVLGQPRLAVVGLEPRDAALLRQGVVARPGSQTAEPGLPVAQGLVHVLGLPALVAVPLQPVLVLLNLLRVVEALPGDLALEVAQGVIVAAAAECLAELDLHRAELVEEVVNLDALGVLVVGWSHAVAQALGGLGLLEALLADPIAILGLEGVGSVPLLDHPVDAVAAPGRARGAPGGRQAREGTAPGRACTEQGERDQHRASAQRRHGTQQ
mmetsp:Transcript_22797/g.68345  ORF Transcript_22797/g.68345 Transcript_22797/m.68345 type:complete len:244 (-) Transcript_22797:33-764(-)